MSIENKKGDLKMEKVSKEKFEAYEGVRKSGQTNMLDIPVVIRLAAMQYLVDLTKEECIYIMKNYKLLNELEEVTEKAGYGVYTKPV